MIRGIRNSTIMALCRKRKPSITLWVMPLPRITHCRARLSAINHGSRRGTGGGGGGRGTGDGSRGGTVGGGDGRGAGSGGFFAASAALRASSSCFKFSNVRS
jgi:hypothetical protein